MWSVVSDAGPMREQMILESQNKRCITIICITYIYSVSLLTCEVCVGAVDCGRCQGTQSGWNVKVTVDTVGYFLCTHPSPHSHRHTHTHPQHWVSSQPLQFNIWISAAGVRGNVKIRAVRVLLLVNRDVL